MANVIIHHCPSLKLARERKETITDYSLVKISSFLSKYAKGKKYYIYTHGCQANYRDSEIFKGILTKIGFKESKDANHANVILINTCAVRENAENKVLGEIGNLKKKDVTLILAGCMAMEEVMVNELIKTFHHVDIILGTHDIAKLPNLLEEHLKKNKRIIEVNSGSGYIHERLPSVRDSSFKAFVNISYGCDKFCTYCIVPYTRGRERSRDPKDIINECKELVKQGYLEITLLGQNVDSYGKDLKKKYSFAKLLDEIAKLKIHRLSFLTSHPYDFSLEIIDVMKKHKNIQPYLHLPLQSGDDKILKLMGRKYDSKKYLSIIKVARKKMPDLFISTDIIVGFPNESDTQFKNTLKMVKSAQYDGAFTFIYSKRSGTPAAKMVDKISNQTKVKRFKELTSLLNQIIEKNNKKYLNKTYEVLVDSVSKNNPKALTGRMHNNKMINFNGSQKYVGKLVKVKVTSTHIHYLIGEMVK
ncbi:MAG: tRNA (N6-isopentenyl adenosine(37)-C2)-methylthiotransferase MiaB [Bacilli bacterium]|nr:tRNA (N6-isopentenyl adenosine(37)-C2)-methylthiotransferase MiaB [Bacilli bacterium]